MPPTGMPSRRLVVLVALGVAALLAGATGLVLGRDDAVVAEGADSRGGSGVPAPPAPAELPRGPLMAYVVNTAPGEEATARGAEAVAGLSSEVVAQWPQIGVVVAQSTVVGFAELVRAADGVQSAGATRTAAVTRLPPAAPEPEQEPVPTPPGLPPEGQAYDVAAVRADEAHRQPGGRGSPDVLVAVLDGGIEDTHPDLAANVDAAASAGCTDGGRLDRSRAAWLPTSTDHGTHVAGTIAADDDGQGVVGVAPDVRISSVKVVDDDGLIFPEYAVCGYLWAAESGADVSSASLYVDPWQYWCPDDPDQAAAVESVRRAVAHATTLGVLHVAAAGNDGTDLADKRSDDTSPNDTVPVERPLTAACTVLPAELEGVVTVSAVDEAGVKPAFSNWGLGVVDVTAPGVDVWSTTLGGGHAQKSGTSMAAPHAAGVAALLVSRLPTATPDELARLLGQQAVDLPCPAGPATSSVQPCGGSAEDNGYAGEGVVDALAAVTGTLAAVTGTS